MCLPILKKPLQWGDNCMHLWKLRALDRCHILYVKPITSMSYFQYCSYILHSVVSQVDSGGVPFLACYLSMSPQTWNRNAESQVFEIAACSGKNISRCCARKSGMKTNAFLDSFFSAKVFAF
ncbi:hypothetical protein KIL84_009333 [Mauremys mutica]|uniref:Uncharacterized protein n=1 Tax=Mauremys mutica TaxID=74926 RepID=A0A9D3XIX1_9SAUR|nr:hypothetical protein KIL84_009333 [Mauremys mutica]